MCGRYSCTADLSKLASRFLAEELASFPALSILDIKPGSVCAAVLGGQKRLLAPLCWGFALGHGPTVINSRAETLLAERQPFSFSRCLVPATGFYEWKQEGRSKVPYRFRMKDGDFFAMAGIWLQLAGEKAFSIITVPANSLVAGVHPRMPAIIPPESEAEWLDGRPLRFHSALMAPFPVSKMAADPNPPELMRREGDLPGLF